MKKVFEANKNLYLSIMEDKHNQNKTNYSNGLISCYEYMTINKTIYFGKDVVDMSLFSMKDFLKKSDEYISCSPIENEKEILEIISTYINNYVTLVELHSKNRE
ncbi:MAG: hypothetical protein PHS04_00475 [Tissierellia bacterium]|nr:hypothetical protein [Tissierellia bacterium]